MADYTFGYGASEQDEALANELRIPYGVELRRYTIDGAEELDPEWADYEIDVIGYAPMGIIATGGWTSTRISALRPLLAVKPHGSRPRMLVEPARIRVILKGTSMWLEWRRPTADSHLKIKHDLMRAWRGWRLLEGDTTAKRGRGRPKDSGPIPSVDLIDRVVACARELTMKNCARRLGRPDEVMRRGDLARLEDVPRLEDVAGVVGYEPSALARALTKEGWSWSDLKRNMNLG